MHKDAIESICGVRSSTDWGNTVSSVVRPDRHGGGGFLEAAVEADVEGQVWYFMVDEQVMFIWLIP